ADRTYDVAVAIEPDARTIHGTVKAQFTNTAAVPVRDVALLLYPNRFAGAEPGLNDLNRPYVYPREEPVPGGIAVDTLDAAVAPEAVLAPVVDVRTDAVDGWPRTLLRATLPAPLPPGRSAMVRARFTSILPQRFGPFGVANGA